MEQVKFQVVNNRTGVIVATCTTKKGARQSRDRNDNLYGAYVHSVKEIVSKAKGE